MQGSEGLHGGVGPQGGEGLVGRVLATSVSEHKGTRKHTVDELELRVGVGIVGDAHAGAWHRQVSLLPNESVDRMRERGLELAAGDFAENILTEGLVLRELPVGSVLAVGECRLVVTQIGKSATTTARYAASRACASCRRTAYSAWWCAAAACAPVTWCA